MPAKFFLDATDGSLAFQKEQDFPDWDNSIYEAAAQTNWNTDPGTTVFADHVASGRILDVRTTRRAVILLNPTGTPGSYDFTVKAGANSGNIAGYYDLDGGVYTGESGLLYVGVDTLGIDYLLVVVDNLTTYTALAVEVVPLPYETTE